MKLAIPDKADVSDVDARVVCGGRFPGRRRISDKREGRGNDMLPESITVTGGGSICLWEGASSVRRGHVMWAMGSKVYPPEALMSWKDTSH